MVVFSVGFFAALSKLFCRLMPKQKEKTDPFPVWTMPDNSRANKEKGDIT